MVPVLPSISCHVLVVAVTDHGCNNHRTVPDAGTGLIRCWLPFASNSQRLFCCFAEQSCIWCERFFLAAICLGKLSPAAIAMTSRLMADFTSVMDLSSGEFTVIRKVTSGHMWQC